MSACKNLRDIQIHDIKVENTRMGNGKQVIVLEWPFACWFSIIPPRPQTLAPTRKGSGE